MRKLGLPQFLAAVLAVCVFFALLVLASVDSTWAFPSSQGGTLPEALTVYMPELFTITPSFTVGSPNGLGSALNRLFIANRDQDTVTVWDENTRMVTATIPVGGQPWGVGIFQTTVLVSNFASQPPSLSVIDASALTKQSDISLSACPGQPGNIAIDPTKGIAYVAMYAPGTSGSVAVVDAAHSSFIRCLPAGPGTFGIAIDPVLARLYVANRDSKDIQVFDASDPGSGNPLLQNLVLGGVPFSIQADSATHSVYVMVAVDAPDYSTANKLEVFAGSSTGLPMVPSRTLVIGNTDPGGQLWISQANGMLFVAAAASNQLWVIDPTTFATRIEPLASPFVLAENLSLHRLYVGSRAMNLITVEPDTLHP